MNGFVAVLPTVVVPVFNGRLALDACLASLECTLPDGATLWLADDASSDPQIEPLARGWCQRSRLQAHYRRRESRLGLAGNCRAALAETDDVDIVICKPDGVATPGWLQQLARCAAAAPRSASISAWSDCADLCSFPRMGASLPMPLPDTVATAAGSLSWPEYPELPTASGPCLFLRRSALRQLGGLDASSFFGERALDDFCRRAAAMGWQNLLCPAAFVARQDADAGATTLGGEDMDTLLARWPDFQEQVARFILSDPLRPFRDRLQARIDELSRSGPQRDLFN